MSEEMLVWQKKPKSNSIEGKFFISSISEIFPIGPQMLALVVPINQRITSSDVVLQFGERERRESWLLLMKACKLLLAESLKPPTFKK